MLGHPSPGGRSPWRLPSPPGAEALGQERSALSRGPLASTLLLYHPLSTLADTQAARKTAWQHASCVKQEDRPRWWWGAEPTETALPSSQHCFSSVKRWDRLDSMQIPDGNTTNNLG